MSSAIELHESSHLAFVTGKLAEQSVRDVVGELSTRYGFDYSVVVMPITVAALMTPKWIAKHLQLPSATTHVIVPGFCDLRRDDLQQGTDLIVVNGPKDCRRMEEIFGVTIKNVELSAYDIEIIAEINHAPRVAIEDFVAVARGLVKDGADRIDIGCDPARRCDSIGSYVRELVELGIPVSIDTFDSWEAQAACDAGASLVLSVNSANRSRACDWGAEVVAIPDTPDDLDSLYATIEYLAKHDVAFRVDPILEPIGSGLTDSLIRYTEVRRRYPEAEMMMGIGNLTELTDTDSAAINLVLLGICQELGVRSVLTTQVINWARSSVRECDLARRMVYRAVQDSVPPKNLSDDLVLLRDRRIDAFSDQALGALADSIKDNNYRLFAQGDVIHLISRQLHLVDADPFRLFEKLMAESISDNVDPGHAFYLGFEMAKATIALSLGKQYEQDRPLDWGFLTRNADFHRIARSNRHRKDP